MADSEQKTFHCDLIDPTGKLLDCETTSVVLPAHDGQRGILYDHMPMLCQLGLGIMRVAVVSATEHKEAPAAPGPDVSQPAGLGAAPTEASFFVDGGFALVAANSVMVVAREALALRDIKPEKIQSLIEKTGRNLETPTLSVSQRAHENERLRALQKLIES
jgi:F0F1-type ATP synthase epsilon subunit